jgi:hypothetical protein
VDSPIDSGGEDPTARVETQAVESGTEVESNRASATTDSPGIRRPFFFFVGAAALLSLIGLTFALSRRRA